MSAFGEGGGVLSASAMCLASKWLSETRRTWMVTHFMSTVRADNFCPIDRTIWQCFESEFAVHKSFLHFLSLSVHRVFPEPPNLLLLLLIPFLILLPPSGSRLKVPSTAVNHAMRVSFFFIYRVLIARLKKKKTALRGCCVYALLMH